MSRDLEKKKEYQKKYYQENKEKLKKYRQDWYYENRELGLERSKKWAENNPDARKRNVLKSAYNISLEEFKSMFEEQKGCCKICGRHQSELPKNLHVDHDHKTGLVRGLLCYRCNSALGFINDNVEILEKMINYLKNASSSYIYQDSGTLEQISEF